MKKPKIDPNKAWEAEWARALEHRNKVLSNLGLNPENYVGIDYAYNRGHTISAKGTSYPTYKIWGDSLSISGYPVIQYKDHYALVSKYTQKDKNPSVVEEFWLDSKGLYHREDGPAQMLSWSGSSEWWWHGKQGLENFPDEIVAMIGDTVI